MTDYNDGNWHGWDGNERPVHELSEVDVVWRYHDSRDAIFHSGVKAGAITFAGDGHGRVVLFRVVKEHKEPREFWLGYNWVTYRTKKDAEDSYGTPSGRVIHVREVLE